MAIDSCMYFEWLATAIAISLHLCIVYITIYHYVLKNQNRNDVHPNPFDCQSNECIVLFCHKIHPNFQNHFRFHYDRTAAENQGKTNNRDWVEHECLHVYVTRGVTPTDG